jgi:hypothetical protein
MFCLPLRQASAILRKDLFLVASKRAPYAPHATELRVPAPVNKDASERPLANGEPNWRWRQNALRRLRESRFRPSSPEDFNEGLDRASLLGVRPSGRAASSRHRAAVVSGAAHRRPRPGFSAARQKREAVMASRLKDKGGKTDPLATRGRGAASVHQFNRKGEGSRGGRLF